MTDHQLSMMTREQYIDACQAMDPNGAYTDEHARADGVEPMTLAEAREAYHALLAEQQLERIWSGKC